jgi:hypothetical protein
MNGIYLTLLGTPILALILITSSQNSEKAALTMWAKEIQDKAEADKKTNYQNQ